MNNTTPHPDPQRARAGSADICEDEPHPKAEPEIWLYECTRKESSISTKGTARETTRHPPSRQAPSHPADEVKKIGIQFWHAVEFSRNGRTPTRRLSATRRGNPSSLGQPFRRGQIRRTGPKWIELSRTARHLCHSGAGLAALFRVYLTRAACRTCLPIRRPLGVPGALT